MRRHLLLGLAALAALALAGNVLAQGSPVQVAPGTPTSTLSGTVVAVSANELVIDTPSGRQRFIVDSNSTLPANLAAGTRVSVEYHRLEGDRRHVARVTTAAPESPRADAPPTLDDPTLPRTASPLLIVGALGLASLLASKALQIANQGH
jgi:RNase P/RNase MRP subunit p29